MTVNEFFTALGDAARWPVGVSIKRTNPLPLDDKSVFASLQDATDYAAGVLAYPGQVIAVVTTTETKIYYIDHTMTLQEMGQGGQISIDPNTLVDNNGTIAIKGYADAAVGAQLTKTSNGLEWVVPSSTTIEGLSSAVSALQTSVTGLTSDMQKREATLVFPVGGSEDAISDVLLPQGTIIRSIELTVSTALTADAIIGSGVFAGLKRANQEVIDKILISTAELDEATLRT